MIQSNTTPMQTAAIGTGGLAGLDALSKVLKWGFAGFPQPSDAEAMAIVLLVAPTLYLLAAIVNGFLARRVLQLQAEAPAAQPGAGA